MWHEIQDALWIALAVLFWIVVATLALCAGLVIIWIVGHFGDFLGMWEV